MLLLLPLSCFSRVRLCVTPETAAHQAPLSLGFSRQEDWSGLPFPFPGVRNWEHFNITGAKQEVVKEEEGERSGHQITADLKIFFRLCWAFVAARAFL